MAEQRTYVLKSNRSWTLGDATQVMGILNLTPDSFSDGGQWFNLDRALAHVTEMEEAGGGRG